MIDAHCHVPKENAFVCAASLDDWPRLETLPGSSKPFFGIHPWHLPSSVETGAFKERLKAELSAFPASGVGETGLDRMRTRDENVLAVQTLWLRAHLEVAAKMHRPVVLHGAKCWGRVVSEIRPFAREVPAFLFHGFSRSGGLLGEMALLNGFISVSKAVLNCNAVNYRSFLKTVPLEMLLVETDAEDGAEGPAVEEVLSGLSALLGIDAGELEQRLDGNAARFAGSAT
jgi:Tat protein secretion system quality control protein TatD with DNase activity